MINRTKEEFEEEGRRIRAEKLEQSCREDERRAAQIRKKEMVIPETVEVEVLEVRLHRLPPSANAAHAWADLCANRTEVLIYSTDDAGRYLSWQRMPVATFLTMAERIIGQVEGKDG